MTGIGAIAHQDLPRVVKAVRTKAPPVPRDVQFRALQTTARYVLLARQLYGKNFPMPTVAFDLRGKTAGQAFLGRNLIRYNAVLLVENEADFEADTIPHEVAHLIADQVYGRAIAAHGTQWQSVMHRFGVTPRRTHDYDVSNSTVGGIHRYVCGCGTVFQLGPRKHKQAARGLIACRKCGGRLRLEGTPPQATPVAPVPRTPVRPGPAATPWRPTARPAISPRPPAPPTPRTPVPVPVRTPTVRPATPAQLQYALSLAHRLGIALQQEHIASFEQCSSFIERYKVVGAAKPAQSSPSERQLQYARDIARRKGLTLAADVLSDSRKLSAWIDQNR